MRVLLLVLLPLALLAAASAAAARTRRDSPTPLDAELFGADPGPRSDREKRLLLEQKVQIGNSVKNAVLNLIFGKINSVIDSKSALVGVFERANAAKNLALLGPGTKRPPQGGGGLKALLGGVLSSSLGSSSGSSLGSSSGGGGSSDTSASLGASIGGSGPDSGTSSASSSASASAGTGVGYGFNAQAL